MEYSTKQLTQLPSSVTVTRKESFSPDVSKGVFSQATAFVSATLGENFGHVIAEALSVGCPVFVTAPTPWTELILSGAGRIIISDEQAAAELVSRASLTHTNHRTLKPQQLCLPIELRHLRPRFLESPSPSDPPPRQMDPLITVPHGREPVGNHNQGDIAGEGVRCFGNDPLSFSIQCRSGFIKYE